MRLLGPVEVSVNGRLVDLGPPRQRAVLALLALRANEVVSIDRLLDELWGQDPPRSAAHALQVYVSNLRRALEPDRPKGSPGSVLATRAPGYSMVLDPGTSDLARFEALAASGRLAAQRGDLDEGADSLRRALGEWRGTALADVAFESFAAPEARRLEELRVAVTEDRIDADLALGRHVALVGELDALARRHPLRERLWAQLMTALYRAGRQADALRVYQELRTSLGDELGLAPSPALASLESDILRHAPELTAVRAAPEPAAADRAPTPTSVAPAMPPPIPTGPGQPADTEVRAVVTVLVADLVGSTPLGELLDPEDYKLVVDGATARMVHQIEAFGGSVTNVAGDGVVALFGAPVAHEDDPERALRAGLRLVEDVTAYGAEVGQAWGVDPVAVRVGIHSGPVIFGAVSGGAASGETGMGDTMNTGARLQGEARPGTVLVSESTRRMVERLCEWGEPRSLHLKGKADTVSASEAHELHAIAGKLRGITGVEVGVVGRDAELGRVADAIDGVAHGRGGVLLLTGEAGVGKSRLLAEMRDRFSMLTSVESIEGQWLEGRCVSYGEGIHYWPLRELLRGWLGASINQPELRARITLRRKAEAVFGAQANELLPALATVLGVALEPDAASTVAELRPETIDQAVFDALRSLLERLAEHGPVVVAVDDLHWSDVDSLRLLERLLPACGSAAILFVLAGRPERSKQSWHLRELALRDLAHRTEEITLEALPAGSDAALLDALVGAGTLPDEVTARVLAAAEGNPFYVEEIVRSLMGSGVLVHEDARWRFEGDATVEIPESVEKVLLTRIDQLAPQARAVLRAAAVLGRQFRVDLLDAVLDSTSTDVLAELERADLVREERRWPTAEYRFKHVLIQDAAYRTLTSERRRELHRRVVRALETTFPDRSAETFGLLAHHLTEAGEIARALPYRLLAANEARRVFAIDVALGQFGAGLDAATELRGGDAAEVINELRLGRGDVLALRGGFNEGRADLEAALAGARATGQQRVEYDALEILGRLSVYMEGQHEQGLSFWRQALDVARSLNDGGAQVKVLNRLAADMVGDLNFNGALTLADEALAIATDAADERVMAMALDARKLVAAYLGDFDALASAVATLEDILRRDNDLWLLAWVLAESSIEPAARGRWQEAIDLLHEAITAKRRMVDGADESLLVAMVASLERTRGAYQPALDAGTEAAAIASAQDHAWGIAWSNLSLGATLLDLHDPPAAVGHLTIALAAAERAASRSLEMRCSALLAWASCLEGDTSQADLHLRRAEALLSTVRAPEGAAFLYGSDGYLAVARVHLARQETDEASAVLLPLLAAAEHARWGEPWAGALLLIGRVEMARGDDARAMTSIDQALEVATSNHLTNVAAEATIALAHLHARAGDHDGAQRLSAEARSLIASLSAGLASTEATDRFVQGSVAGLPELGR